MQSKRGFTLIELLAVIVILAVIMVIAVPQILKIIESSKNSVAESSIKLVKDAIKTQVATSEMSGVTFNKEDGCYEFDFDNQVSENVSKLSLKNKDKIGGNIKYCSGKFQDDNLTFNGESISVAEDEFFPINRGLVAYFDYSNFKNNLWENSISSGNNIEFSGTGELTSNGVKIDMKNKNVFATLPIDNSKNNITIYLVAKAIENNIDNARLIEIPKYPSNVPDSQSYTTPVIFTTPLNIGYGIFKSDKITEINSNNFNVFALQINMDKNELKININNTLNDTISGLNGFGDTLYLSKCTFSSEGYGNNEYKMLSVSYSLHTDDEMRQNVNWLIDRYIK